MSGSGGGGGAASDKRRWPPRLVDHPREGYFACKFAPGAPEVAAKVLHEKRASLFRPLPEAHWLCWINGKAYEHEGTVNPFANARVMMICNHGREISAFEYDALLDAQCGVDPFQPVDLRTLPVPF